MFEQSPQRVLATNSRFFVSLDLRIKSVSASRKTKQNREPTEAGVTITPFAKGLAALTLKTPQVSALPSQIISQTNSAAAAALWD